MSGFESENKPPGINKHLYSTNPDAIVGDNIYSNDKSSINKEESYQTLDNRTVPVDTGEKINPFNVKGVPGCKECGGSGWKETKKHPHPCNECAKKTVPVIDTYLTKVGHSAQQTVESQPVFQTAVSQNTHEVEMHGNLPVTREVRYTEEVPVKTQVPVTRYEEVVQNVPVERVEYVTENIPVKTTMPVSEQNIQELDYAQRNTIPENNERSSIYPVTGLDETTRNKFLTQDSHEHDTNALNQVQTHLQGFVGVPGCKE